MTHQRIVSLLKMTVVFAATLVLLSATKDNFNGFALQNGKITDFDDRIIQDSLKAIENGRRTFRFDAFGSEDFWGGKLRLHEAILGAQNGGIGAGVSPKTALSVGLKVDSDALPAGI